MKRPQQRPEGRGALDLIEEAVHLLRTAPTGAWAAYLAGSLPFVLGLLFFSADMSRSPYARDHVVEAALGLGLLFLWMKFCQALFARRIRAQLAGEPGLPLGWRRGARLALLQAALQPTGLFLLPLAALVALPFAWAYAFYQNATILADGGEHDRLRDLMSRASRQARRWPGQNHVLLVCLGLFGLFVLLNLGLAGALLPGLLKALLGVETVFSRSGLALLNTTFFAVVLGFTYLCVDPIVKAVYVLRCFYGESVESGADLRAELRQFVATGRGAAGAVAVILLACGVMNALGLSSEERSADKAVRAPGFMAAMRDFTIEATSDEPEGVSSIRSDLIEREAHAMDAPVRAPENSVSPKQLDRAIEQVIQQKKFTWRMPRERAVEDDSREKGILALFFQQLADMLRRWISAAGNWLDSWLRRISWRSSPWGPPTSSGPDWAMLMQLLLYALMAAVVASIGWMFYRIWRNRRRPVETLESDTALAPVDVADENIAAEQLPEDGWTKLARELLARGEFRLALRAFYLASLAHLAERNLITLARFKSNHEYERELERRAHAFPGLIATFGENVEVFDRVWYGTHSATSGLVADFAAKVECIKTGGQGVPATNGG